MLPSQCCATRMTTVHKQPALNLEPEPHVRPRKVKTPAPRRMKHVLGDGLWQVITPHDRTDPRVVRCRPASSTQTRDGPAAHELRERHQWRISSRPGAANVMTCGGGVGGLSASLTASRIRTISR